MRPSGVPSPVAHARPSRGPGSRRHRRHHPRTAAVRRAPPRHPASSPASPAQPEPPTPPTCSRRVLLARAKARLPPNAGCVASALVVQGAQDEPPRSQAMTAPALRSGKTIVRASANAIAEPLGQLIVVRGCPPTVDLEPVVRVADGFRCIHAHQIRIAPTTPTHALATQPPVGVLFPPVGYGSLSAGGAAARKPQAGVAR